MITGIHTTTGHGMGQICVALSVPHRSYHHAAHPTASQLTDGHLGDFHHRDLQAPPPPLRLPQNPLRAHGSRHHLCARQSPQNHDKEALKSHTTQELNPKNQRRTPRKTLGQSLVRPASSGAIQSILGRRDHPHTHLNRLALSRSCH